jgi:allophanate hydrolase subunit 2
MAHGVPPGGALVPERLVAANRAVGNAGGSAAVEAFGGLVVAARGGDLRVAWDGVAAWLPRDHVRTLPPPGGGRVAYLAVAGGLDVPVVLGGRGLLLAAGFGGGVGRPLRAGDRLPVGPLRGPDRHTPFVPDPFVPDPAAAIRVLRGPDLARFALDAWAALLAGPWRVGAASDRVGARLDGPPLARVDGDLALSTPMVRGGVQVPGGGGPIVLGPDHPTTGGYPLLAVVVRADQGALALRGAGAPVVFREVDDT